MNELELSFDPSRFDLAAIHAFLASSYWSPGIPRQVLERAIAGSLCIGALRRGEQVGFGRLVTDRATFAYLADVYVLPEHRGQGVARAMLEALLAHPEVQGLRRVMLATRDAHALYAKFGFKALSAPDRFMELHQPQAYLSQARGAE